jgi:hypothetical protein
MVFTADLPDVEGDGDDGPDGSGAGNRDLGKFMYNTLR